MAAASTRTHLITFTPRAIQIFIQPAALMPIISSFLHSRRCWGSSSRRTPWHQMAAAVFPLYAPDSSIMPLLKYVHRCQFFFCLFSREKRREGEERRRRLQLISLETELFCTMNGSYQGQFTHLWANETRCTYLKKKQCAYRTVTLQHLDDPS